MRLVLNKQAAVYINSKKWRRFTMRENVIPFPRVVLAAHEQPCEFVMNKVLLYYREGGGGSQILCTRNPRVNPWRWVRWYNQYT